MTLTELIEKIKEETNKKKRVDEVWYNQTPHQLLNPTTIEDFKQLDLDDGKVIYTGRKYLLWFIPNKSGRIRGCLVISDKTMNILFYQNVEFKHKDKIQLKSRINVSKIPFERLIGTLLYFGYTIIEDNQINIKALDSIWRMIFHNEIDVFHKGRELSLAEFNELIHIDDKDIVFEYRQIRPTHTKLLEVYSTFANEDAFDLAERNEDKLYERN
jgi:hypothetical protein